MNELKNQEYKFEPIDKYKNDEAFYTIGNWGYEFYEKDIDEISDISFILRNVSINNKTKRYNLLIYVKARKEGEKEHQWYKVFNYKKETKANFIKIDYDFWYETYSNNIEAKKLSDIKRFVILFKIQEKNFIFWDTVGSQLIVGKQDKLKNTEKEIIKEEERKEKEERERKKNIFQEIRETVNSVRGLIAIILLIVVLVYVMRIKALRKLVTSAPKNE